MKLRITSILAGLSAGMILASGAHALDKVTFGTNWVAESEHGGFYQSIADGTYQKCGLDVEILPGGPQVNNRAKMLAGKLDFHMGGNMLQAFSAYEQKIPLKVIAAFFQKEPQVFMTHPGQGLDKWEDLKGINMLVGNNGFQSFFQWMIKEHGFRAEQRKPYTYNPAPFLADKRLAQQGYITSEPFAIKKQGGFMPNVFLLADYGFNTYSTTVEVMEDTMKNKPAAVKCFIEGSITGWYNYLYGDASAGNALIQKHNPDMADDQIAFSIETMKKYGIVDSGDAIKLGIGAMTAERHQNFYDKMVEVGVANKGVDVSKVYTLDYVNKGHGLDLRKKLTGN
jgi:NitT/TauT family transport system substrate-binding protein